MPEFMQNLGLFNKRINEPPRGEGVETIDIRDKFDRKKPKPINKYEWDTVVGEENPYQDFITQAKLNRREKTELGILQGQKEMENTYGPLTPEQEQRMKELLQKELEV